MRLAIAAVLDWAGSWLGCIADYIGNPGVYDWQWPTPASLWRGLQQSWWMWHTDIDPDAEFAQWEQASDEALLLTERAARG